MRKVTRWLALIVLCAGPMWAQGSNITLTVGPPPPVPSVSAMPVNPITTVAPQTLYYWVIARYSSGAAIPTGPATVTSTPASLLDGTHRIEIDWTGISGVLGYDVVRNTTNIYPGTCAACAVVILTTNLTVNDTGGLLAAYPPVPWNTAPGVGANIGLNNQSSPYPFLQVSVGGLSGKMGILSGAYAANDCIRVNADGTISSTGVSCGTGGGGSVTSVGLALPSIFSVTGTPVTGAGTLTGVLATQAANTVFAGPATGVAAAPTFRSLALADMPSGLLTASGPPTNHQVPVWSSAINLKGVSLAANAILAGVTAADPAGLSLGDLEATLYVVGGGTAQAQTAVLAPAATALAAGLTVRWLPTTANTAAGPTLAVNGLTATTVTKCGTSPLVDGDLSTAAVAVATYDGTQFQLQNPQVVGCGTTPAAGGGTGVSFYLDDTTLVPLGVNNVNQVNTLTKIPVTSTSVVTDNISVASNTVLGEAYLYNTALGLTSIPGGIWTFNIYAQASSTVGGRVSTITQNAYTVTPYAANITTTGTLGSRTATAASGTPFASAKIVASVNPLLASFLQTPQGLYQITARSDDVTVTITTPTLYSNENPATSYSVWTPVASGTTQTITNTSGFLLYSVGAASATVTVGATTKLGSILYGTSNNTTTVSFQHNGTATYSNFVTPIPSIHNDLSGLQGGSSTERYHLTSAQSSALLATGVSTRTVDCTFDGGGAVITLNAVCYKRVPVAGTITGWSIEAQGTNPAVTIDVLKVASGTVLPSASIAAAALPVLTGTNNAVVSTAVSTWNGSSPVFVANDIVGFKVTVPGAATWAHIAVYYTVP